MCPFPKKRCAAALPESRQAAPLQTRHPRHCRATNQQRTKRCSRRTPNPASSRPGNLLLFCLQVLLRGLFGHLSPLQKDDFRSIRKPKQKTQKPIRRHVSFHCPFKTRLTESPGTPWNEEPPEPSWGLEEQRKYHPHKTIDGFFGPRSTRGHPPAASTFVINSGRTTLNTYFKNTYNTKKWVRYILRGFPRGRASCFGAPMQTRRYSRWCFNSSTWARRSRRSPSTVLTSARISSRSPLRSSTRTLSS